MNNQDPEILEKEQERIKSRVELLFLQYAQPDPAHDLATISEYFAFLSKGIDYKRMNVKFDMELLDPIEAVEMLLYERLKFHPESVVQQVQSILREEKVSHTLGVLSHLTESDRANARYAENKLIKFFASIAGVYNGLGFDLVKSYGLSPEALLKTKVALKRVSQLVRYAGTLNVYNAYHEFRDFSGNYDPNRVNRNKLIGLINILKAELDVLPATPAKERLVAQVQDLENEVKKKSPRWGPVIAGFFFVMSVLADFRSVAPDVYDRSVKMVESILVFIRDEGLVTPSESSQKLPDHFPEDGQGRLPPRVALPPSNQAGSKSGEDEE